MISKIKRRINHFLRYTRIQLRIIQHPVDKNTHRTVICNNCVGAMVLHDFGMQFDSPFVNLFVRPDDYLKILKNPDKYLSEDSSLKDITSGAKYPIGLLEDDVRIHFLHYKSFEEAKNKWYKRLSRMDLNNIYYIFVQQNGCNDSHLAEFSKLSFKNKVLLTNRTTDLLTSEIHIPGFEDKGTIENITDYNGWTGKRYYDSVDWRQFLNI